MYEVVGDAREFDGTVVSERAAPAPLQPRLLKMAVVVADLVAIVVGMLVAYLASRHLHVRDSKGATKISLLIGAVSLPMWVVLFSRYRLYSARRVSTRLDELGRLIHAALGGTLGMAALAYLTVAKVSRGWLILCFPIIVVTCCIEREAVRATFKRLRRSGRLLRSVVLVGANAEAESIYQLLENRPTLGYRIVGVVDDGDGSPLMRHPVLGGVSDTLDVVRATGATGVIVATTAVSAVKSNSLVRELVDGSVHVEMSSSLQDIDSQRLTVQPLGNYPVVYIEPVRRGGWRAAAKRTFDIGGSVVALVAVAPLLAVVALIVKLDSPGRVFFSQVRVGKDGKPFWVHKIRTMAPNAADLLAELSERNQAEAPLFKVVDDPRVTRAGKVLRRFSIDEIPQLWNVLRGEMSLVGPRPGLYSEMDMWTPELKRSRLRVRPGLTGMWQVSGRSNLSFADYVRLDVCYVDNWTLWQDLAILAKTLPVVVSKRGAY